MKDNRKFRKRSAIKARQPENLNHNKKKNFDIGSIHKQENERGHQKKVLYSGLNLQQSFDSETLIKRCNSEFIETQIGSEINLKISQKFAKNNQLSKKSKSFDKSKHS